MSDGQQCDFLLNTCCRNLYWKDTDTAGSWKVDEEENVASNTVMIVADEVQMVIGGGSVITLTIDYSGTCGFPTSRKSLLVLTGHGIYVTSLWIDSLLANMFLLVGQTPKHGTMIE